MKGQKENGKKHKKILPNQAKSFILAPSEEQFPQRLGTCHVAGTMKTPYLTALVGGSGSYFILLQSANLEDHEQAF